MNTLINYVRQPDHDALDAELQAYVNRGGRIECVPRGVSGGESRGQYQCLNARQKAQRAAKLYADFPPDEDSP